jgi:acyl-CoA reductase-like NAD-dependent aldehyde dehydrogenase
MTTPDILQRPPSYWEDRARELLLPARAWIDGGFVDATSGKRFKDISPRDGSVLTEVAECGEQDVDRAVGAARVAFEDGRWRKKAPTERKKVLLRLAELVRERQEDLALIETLDVGKPIADSLNVDITAAATYIQWYAEAIDKRYGEIAPSPPDSLALVTREPMGVVGAVIPWNYPLILTTWKVAPALATGNSVVLKPAEQSPLSALVFAELAADAGLPDGVLNVVPGFGEVTGAALGRHPDVDKITFTGSTEVGKAFLRYAGESNMKSVSLECGGKSPQLIMADASNLDEAASSVASGIFYNAGQTCHAGSRVLVDRRIKDDLLERLIAFAEDMPPGDPLDPATQLGTIVDDKQMERVLGYMDVGRREGASVAVGGKRALEESGGFYVEPTIFDGVRQDMRIANEEIFGPVLGLLEFASEEEGVALANSTRYGLAASVWTRDISTAHRVSGALRAGTVWVNCFDASDVTVPFGGFKESGNGRDKSLHALEQYEQLKTVWLDLND